MFRIILVDSYHAQKEFNIDVFFFFVALSLAASGGYGTIIKLLLSAGAEINSR